MHIADLQTCLFCHKTRCHTKLDLAFCCSGFCLSICCTNTMLSSWKNMHFCKLGGKLHRWRGGRSVGVTWYENELSPLCLLVRQGLEKPSCGRLGTFANGGSWNHGDIFWRISASITCLFPSLSWLCPAVVPSLTWECAMFWGYLVVRFLTHRITANKEFHLTAVNRYVSIFKGQEINVVQERHRSHSGGSLGWRPPCSEDLLGLPRLPPK